MIIELCQMSLLYLFSEKFKLLLKACPDRAPNLGNSIYLFSLSPTHNHPP